MSTYTHGGVVQLSTDLVENPLWVLEFLALSRGVRFRQVLLTSPSHKRVVERASRGHGRARHRDRQPDVLIHVGDALADQHHDLAALRLGMVQESIGLRRNQKALGVTPIFITMNTRIIFVTPRLISALVDTE